MILILSKKASDGQLKKVAEDFDGYIKFVVDVERGILMAGGEVHADAEKLLLADGSKQEHLWGGGLDLETGEIDFNSMINLRPGQNNASRDVLDTDVRKKMEEIARRILK